MYVLVSNQLFSVPVTRIPRFCAQRQTSSNATCNGVTFMSVIFIETCAMPYSSMNQPIAFVPFQRTWNHNGFSILIFHWFTNRWTTFTLWASLFAYVECNCISTASRSVFRLKFVAIRKSRAPTAVQPVTCNAFVPCASSKVGCFSFNRHSFC